MKKSAAAVLVLIAGILTAGASMNSQPPKMIEYHKEVDSGETLWDICSELADNQEDVGELVWRTMKENNIKNPGDIQPGQLIIIKVKPVR